MYYSIFLSIHHYFLSIINNHYWCDVQNSLNCHYYCYYQNQLMINAMYLFQIDYLNLEKEIQIFVMDSRTDLEFSYNFNFIYFATHLNSNSLKSLFHSKFH